MKIKVAVLTEDERYLSRIINTLGIKYSDSLELYTFTDKRIAINTISDSKINVVLAEPPFDIDFHMLSDRSDFAWLVEQSDVTSYKGKRAICKFQTIDLLYKQILNIFSEHQEEIIRKYSVGNCKIIAFLPVSGGVGASSLAAAAAINLVSLGKKVLYLNLEKLGSSDVFFSGDGPFDMSDVIFALQSKTANLSMKLESCVKQDKSGVFFFSPAKSSLDMTEMSKDHCIKLLLELVNSDKYDIIVLDMDFGLDEKTLELLNKTSKILWIGDGSETSNSKLLRAYEALDIIEQNRDIQLINRISIIYNKFSNKTGKMVSSVDIKYFSGIPKYEHMTSQKVVDSLSKLNIFSQLV